MLVYSLQSLFFNHYFGNNVDVQVQVAGALVTAVYAKSCKLSSDARAKFTSGSISNLMATDARVLADLTLYLNTLWSGVEQIFVALAMLIGLLGWFPTMAGVMVVVCSIPVQGRLVGIIKYTRELASSWTDERVKIVSEAISGIRVVKLYAWESSFLKRILEVRLGELKLVRHALLVQALSSSLVSAIPTGLSLATFGTFVLLGGQLDAAVVFPAIALFNVLRPPMLILPNVMINVARSAASASRIEKFLLADELTPLADGPHAVPPSEFEACGADVIAKNASFAWDPKLAKSVGPTLSDVDVRIPRGSLVCILGRTASGKSTLLEAMLGEVHILSGHAGIRPNAKVAFCHQIPFIQNGTVRDNILFGQAFDMARYMRVLRVCCLLPDLKVLPAGDMTEIGGRGINFSGGQRARVSLARAVYSQSDVVLLDSPLAAVDAHVARSIFEDCIVGELGGRTRLMATNHVNFASSPAVDFVAIVQDGSLVEFGNRADLQHNSGSIFAALLASQSSARPESGHPVEPSGLNFDERDAEVVDGKHEGISTRKDAENIAGGSQTLRTAEFKDGIYLGLDHRCRARDAKNHVSQRSYRGQLVQREGKYAGRVAIKHYLQYMNAVGGVGWVLVIFGCSCCSQLLNVAVNIWLSIWSGETSSLSVSLSLRSVGWYLGVYTALSISAIAMQSAAEFSLAFSSVRASVWLHERLCLTIFRAPLSFFDTTPTGRIINRFNASIEKIDNSLASTLQSVVRMVLAILTTFALITYSTPWFVAIMIPAAACFLYVQEFYRKTAVDLRRIESITRSPLYSHFGETLDGVVTLRAFGSMPRSIKENRAHTDLNVSVVYVSACANRWLSLRLEILAATMIFSAATLAVISYKVVSPELSGLVLAYAMQTVSSLGWAVRQVTEAESQMSAVEQVSEYSTVPPFPQEDQTEGIDVDQAADNEEDSLRRSESFGLVSNMLVQQIVRGRRRVRQTRWPRRGLVQFKNVTMRYRPGLEPALRGVDLTIEPGWHVGIVGRTGAGKTSLIGTLFRLQEIEDGRIEIDGQDISRMPLIDLRSSLSVIAQEAVLFSGTVRSNLDMAGIYDDAAITRAFHSCGLLETSSGELTLDSVVSESGSNFSVGQRQLICLGRALLRDSMVLVLDEATASLDDSTDNKMGETLRKEMGHCTIIVIAHRLHTVMQCDRVCVMDSGRVVEFGAPTELLKRPGGSLFDNLVNETGPATAAYLRRLAEKSVPVILSPSRALRSPSSPSSPLPDGEPLALLERTRSAIKVLQSSVMELDSPEWAAELQRTNSDAQAWRSALLQMVTSLADVARARLGPVGRPSFSLGVLAAGELNPEDERLVVGSVSPTPDLSHGRTTREDDTSG